MGDSITFINGPFGWQIPCFPVHNAFVYLLHFDQPYKHAKHYLGSTGNLEARLHLHRTGNGARLMEVVTSAGIGFEVARVWKCESRDAALSLEYRLKHRHEGPRLCPLCQGKQVDSLVMLRQGKRAWSRIDTLGRRRPMSECRSLLFVRRID